MKKTKKTAANTDVQSANNRKQLVVWAVIGLLVMAGVMFTLWDYRVWRHAETDKFGQGWSDLDRPASPLTVSYRLTNPKIRLKLPESWDVVEKGGGGSGEDGFVETTTVGKYMVIKTTTATGNLVDLVDVRSLELKNRGMDLKERAYIGGNKLDMTVLEWTEDLSGGRLVVKQEVWGKWGDEVIKIETSADESVWSGIKKTVWAIYENVEMIY